MNPLRTLLRQLLIYGVFSPTVLTAQEEASTSYGWATRMGGVYDDAGRSITTDHNGNIYVTGYFSGQVDFDSGPGTFNLISAFSDGVTTLNLYSKDIFISKFDSSGNFIWAKGMGGSGEDEGKSIVLDTSGNVYVTGSFRGTVDFDPGAGTSYLSSTFTSSFILKLDSNGDFIWARKFGNGSSVYSYSVALDESQNVYSVGYFSGTNDFDPGAGIFNLSSDGFRSDIFISKLDKEGNFLWAKRVGGSDDDYAYSLVLDPFGNIYSTGSFTGTVDFDPGLSNFNLTSTESQSIGSFSSDIFILKLDKDGNFVWSKKMGGALRDKGYSITLDSNGNIYTTGSFSGAVDFDPGPGVFNLTAVIGYNGYLGTDIFVSKLNQNGDFLWANGKFDYWDHEGYSVVTDLAGDVYIAGYSVHDIYLAKFDGAGGGLKWERLTERTYSGNNESIGRSITVDKRGNVYVSGSFESGVNFDTYASAAKVLNSAGREDIFLYKLTQCCLSYEIPILINNLIIENAVCNESSGTVLIEASGGNGTLEFSINGTDYFTSPSFESLPPGNYTVFVREESGGYIVTKTFEIIAEQDTEDPNLNLKPSLTIELGINGLANINITELDQGSSDNCSFTFSFSKEVFSCDDIGENTVIVTATDASGNESSGTVKIMVADKFSPLVITKDIGIQLDNKNSIYISTSELIVSVSDNCTGPEELQFQLSKSEFTCDDIGSNNIELTVTDKSNNSVTAEAVITIAGRSDGCSVTGVSFKQAADVLIMPNPANNNLTIKVPEEASERKVPVHIFEISGSKILETTIDGVSTTIDVSCLASGTYFIMLSFRDSPAYVSRFVVNH